MGVEYRRYLIPRPNTFRPTVETAVALVNALAQNGWILASDSPHLGQLPFKQSRLYAPAKGHGYFARRVGTRLRFSRSVPMENMSKSVTRVVTPWTFTLPTT